MLGRTICNLATIARTKAADPRRSHEGLTEIDTAVWKAALKYLPAQEDRNVHFYIAAGGLWNETDKAAVFGALSQPRVPCVGMWMMILYIFSAIVLHYSMFVEIMLTLSMVLT